VSWSICRWYQLGGADADDVGQNVWLTLLGQLGNLRDPAAPPGWLATTTQRECLRILRAARTPHAGARSLDAENIPDQHTGIAEEELLLAERHGSAPRLAFPSASAPPAGAAWPSCAVTRRSQH